MILRQPDYSELRAKINARAENVNIYRRLTGNRSIPSERGYWTLCFEQGVEPGDEIVQMCNMGLISKTQFVGVDYDAEIIAQNKLTHPDAKWHAGDWFDVIREQDFNPGMIYLDTRSFADHLPAARLVASTMYLCQADTVLFANAMLNDPRSSRRFDPTGLMRQLEKLVGSLELDKWSPKIENFSYNCSGRTDMITYALHKLED